MTDSKKPVPDIIAQFFTVKTKFEIVKRTKKLQLQLQGVPKYVSEHLIQPTKVLLKAVKQLKKSKLIQFVGMANGDLFVRQAEGEFAFKVETLADLERFGWKYTELALKSASAAPALALTPKRNLNQRSPDNQQNSKRPNLSGLQEGNNTRKNVFSRNMNGKSGSRNLGAFAKGNHIISRKRSTEPSPIAEPEWNITGKRRNR